MITLACKKLQSEKAVTCLKLLSLSLVFLLVFSLQKSTDTFKERLTRRAQSTYLLVGAEKDSLKLIQNSLYFTKRDITTLPLKDIKLLNKPYIPLHHAFHSQENPIIGTSLEYFAMRKLRCTKGEFFKRTGEAVLGGQIAQERGLKVGDSIYSNVKRPFDVSTGIPVKMKVVGILERVESEDDFALFISLKTAWTIDGIGHAHSEDEEANLEEYTDLTNFEPKDFHFHGEEENFPITAAFIKPKSNQEKAYLLARSKSSTLNIIEPQVLTEEILHSLSGLNKFITLLIVLFSTALLLALAVSIILSLNLRKSERETLFKLGLKKSYFRKMIFTEWLIILSSSTMTGWLLSLLGSHWIATFVETISGF
jgi:putative ABC transport system permease protein